MIKNQVKKYFQPKALVVAIAFFIAIFFSLQSYFLSDKTIDNKEYSHYINYVIFKQSFSHLVQGNDLYSLYPKEHWDYFKYSPTFALVAAPFQIFPDIIGLILWNLLNISILFYALWKFPFRSEKIKLLVMGFVLIEAVTSIQNSQSNCLIAGLIILAFLSMERQKIAMASLFVVLTIFIKIFGVVALSLFAFYPNKRKAILYTSLWILLLGALPMVVVSPYQLINLYDNWGNLLLSDHNTSYGLSVMGLLYTWVKIDVSKNLILLTGVVAFCLPLLRYRLFKQEKFRQLFLASVLIWMVIFNHKAESPTFIIAVSGVVIWFFIQDFKFINLVLLITAFVFTVLSPTDIFPGSIRDQFMVPYMVKVIPCFFIWLKLLYDLFTLNIVNSKKNKAMVT